MFTRYSFVLLYNGFLLVTVILLVTVMMSVTRVPTRVITLFFWNSEVIPTETVSVP
jgi:hypothetical protein